MMLLSVLVPTIRVRLIEALPLLDELERQARGLPVEVLALFDNKINSVGAKRNKLISSAIGRYLSFVDDDDWIDPYYIRAILERVDEDPAPEVIVFDHDVAVDGGAPKRCRYGVDLKHMETLELYLGAPAHTHAWAEWIPRKHKFPDINVGEDRKWAQIACREVVKQSHIERVLYHYRFNSAKSETRNR